MIATDTNPSEVMTEAGLYRIRLTPSSDDVPSGVEVMLDMHVMADDMAPRTGPSVHRECTGLAPAGEPAAWGLRTTS